VVLDKEFILLIVFDISVAENIQPEALGALPAVLFERLIEHIGFFACQLSCATNSLTSLTDTFFGGFFVVLPHFHLAVNALALHFLFQNAQRLIHVIITNSDFNHATYLLSRLGRSS
jgi:hypothetical protein